MVYEGPRPERADAPADWHVDLRWPILLRELPVPCSLQIFTGAAKVEFLDIGIPGGGSFEDSIAGAVCYTWWCWKLSPANPSFEYVRRAVCKST
jgi:hypothetical protein